MRIVTIGRGNGSAAGWPGSGARRDTTSRSSGGTAGTRRTRTIVLVAVPGDQITAGARRRSPASPAKIAIDATNVFGDAARRRPVERRGGAVLHRRAGGRRAST